MRPSAQAKVGGDDGMSPSDVIGHAEGRHWEPGKVGRAQRAGTSLLFQFLFQAMIAQPSFWALQLALWNRD